MAYRISSSLGIKYVGLLQIVMQLILNVNWHRCYGFQIAFAIAVEYAVHLMFVRVISLILVSISVSTN